MSVSVIELIRQLLNFLVVVHVLFWQLLHKDEMEKTVRTTVTRSWGLSPSAQEQGGEVTGGR